MKRKRKNACPSPLLDDSPKRTKVQAQRKFAQGSNVNSPVITPIKELESELPSIDALPEPVELLPIKRPNTEDFLTFLCFRGTPILPPTLNFFNTASIVDTNGQVHEIKSESSPKNGPIDIAKCGNPSEKPFVAFGVRKRADPIVISKQMDRKRRHALALQALRRKYQEQKMAKIRAVAISKLSERVTNKTLVKTNTVSKTETVTKKSTTMQKTKVVATKHVKVTTQTLKTTLRPSVNQRMCLRSFRGRFIQKELPFRKKIITDKKIITKPVGKKIVVTKRVEPSASGSDLEKEAKTSRGVVKKPVEATSDNSSRTTRSGIVLATNRRKQQKRIIIPDPNRMVKPRILRSTTMKKTVLSRRRSRVQKSKQKPKAGPKDKKTEEEAIKPPNEMKRDFRKVTDFKKESNTFYEKDKKQVNRSLDIRRETSKSTDIKKNVSKVVEIKRSVRISNVVEKRNVARDPVNVPTKKPEETNKKTKKLASSPSPQTRSKHNVVEEKGEESKPKKETAPDKKGDNMSLRSSKRDKGESTKKKDEEKPPPLPPKGEASRKKPEDESAKKKENPDKRKEPAKKDDTAKKKETKEETVKKKEEEVGPEDTKSVEKEKKMEPAVKSEQQSLKESVKPGTLTKVNPRPSRKTKLAAAIYMEILSHKLVDSKIDDDNVSIDSFPELPNVKRTEQRENELKAQAKKDDKTKSLSGDDDDDNTSNEDNPLVIDEDAVVVEEEEPRRLTRNSQRTRSAESSSDDDSDQSFYVDVKVPRKKKMTRSKAPKSVCGKPDKPESSSSNESDESMNLQTLIDMQKLRKFSKTKVAKKSDSFSDSDEEPLSKLTTKSIETLSKREEAPKSQVSRTSGSEKPKRECAKKPQNYLPMFSSSDDEDAFHGFDKKIEGVKDKAPSTSALHLNLLTKDVDRRFGKEKVNMSNEQIEKWLNDSALAGNSIKKENDSMLKFGEKLPLDDTKLKALPLKLEPKDKDTTTTTITVSTVTVDCKAPTKTECVDSKHPKPFISDRKLIFRKSKTENMPNVNAFSPENESSVYAFGEETEELISTPFRRPSRRPSSTATSRSEDESSKHEDSAKIGHFRKPTPKGSEPDPNTDTDETSHQFYVPQKPTKHNFPQKQQPQQQLSTPKGSTPRPKAREKSSDPEDFKYKIPSSPSASSSSSTKPLRRQPQKPKAESVSPVYASDFPRRSEQARLVEAPTFHPTEQEFQDPLEYIERIRHKAEQFGLCKIVPPSSFKPECKVSDDMRFTAYNQYVHKMLHRWGPNFKELMAIKKYLETQSISVAHMPWIGGMEIDLPRLYQTVQNLGGLKEVIEKKKWPKVSELMKIPKSAQDRVTKLDDIYCKYLLPYDTLSPAEREKLFDEVETDWAKRESKGLLKAQAKNVTDENEDNESDSESESDNDVEECITKGRNMALNGFYRIARNTMSMYFKVPEPSAQEVEQMYWNYVTMKENHICVHSGSIDSGSWGYGFAVSKNSPFARHPWNLKVLTNNNGSLLRSLGPVMGVTVPTLHVGMVFSSCCWYRDPHGLPWIEYLHTGGSKIWYGIPDSMSDRFHSTLKSLVPNYCRNTELWLPSDTVMVPPSLLVQNEVSLSRVVQEPGQFVVVFPKAFTSSIGTGYVVSESVYFAPAYWLRTARGLFDALRSSSEPSMFSLDKLLLNIAGDQRCGVDVLRQVEPFVEELCAREASGRKRLCMFGEMEREKLDVPDVGKKKKKFQQGDEGDYECDVCRMSLFVSVVFDFQETVTYCLDHAVEAIETKKASVSKLKLMIAYDDDELASVPDKVRGAIESKLQKKGGSK